MFFPKKTRNPKFQDETDSLEPCHGFLKDSGSEKIIQIADRPGPLAIVCGRGVGNAQKPTAEQADV